MNIVSLIACQMSDDDVTAAQPDPAQFPESRDSLTSNQQQRNEVVSGGEGVVLAAVRSVERRVRALSAQTARLSRRLTSIRPQVRLNNNNNKHDDIYSEVITAEPLREFTRFTR